MAKIVADLPMKSKPTLRISDEDYKGIETLSLKDNVKIIASGKVISLDTNMWDKKRKYSATIELDEVEIHDLKE